MCAVKSGHHGSETISSLPGLACAGWRDGPGLVVPSSPFPLLTGLGLLLKTITGLHKGLSKKVGPTGSHVDYNIRYLDTVRSPCDSCPDNSNICIIFFLLFFCFSVQWRPPVRTCDWIPVLLQWSHAHTLPHQSLAPQT